MKRFESWAHELRTCFDLKLVARNVSSSWGNIVLYNFILDLNFDRIVGLKFNESVLDYWKLVDFCLNFIKYSHLSLHSFDVAKEVLIPILLYKLNLLMFDIFNSSELWHLLIHQILDLFESPIGWKSFCRRITLNRLIPIRSDDILLKLVQLLSLIRFALPPLFQVDITGFRSLSSGFCCLSRIVSSELIQVKALQLW